MANDHYPEQDSAEGREYRQRCLKAGAPDPYKTGHFITMAALETVERVLTELPMVAYWNPGSTAVLMRSDRQLLLYVNAEGGLHQSSAGEWLYRAKEDLPRTGTVIVPAETRT